MISYFLKVILCSGILLSFYYLFLEKVKIFQFNRLYLLSSLLISFFIPLVELEISNTLLTQQTFESIKVKENNRLLNYNLVETNSDSKVNEEVSLRQIFWCVYLLISGILIYRFFKGILFFRKKEITNQSIDYEGFEIILTDENQTPFSFLSKIYLNKNLFENKQIETEIIEHEMTHIKQGHTFDILFVEFLFALFWFNPFIVLYGKCIRLNHEFLADQSVLSKNTNKSRYQYLLLNEFGLTEPRLLTSKFNFSFTKKRLKMMNKEQNKSKAILVKISMLPLLLILISLFGKIGVAQSPKNETNEIIPLTEATQAQMNEYEELVNKYLTTFKNGSSTLINTPNDEDRAKLQAIFLTMNAKQQESQKFIMIPPLPPLAINKPSEKEFEAFKNGKVYGVWLDDKKIPNTELNKLNAEDIYHVFVSKLYPNAQKTIGYKYKFQVDLMTKLHYEKYLASELENKNYILMPKKVKL
ncbi:M56 family metallopeptidase [Lacihabitans sp. LS3-19]|uniref:M56 family metallopeptidase n=1 Tax=Lacihabitans sp. LS3-19 TaxID=2487335 RepID=UPI0020CD9B53|nr:M56 family metallopeptidase [Lacihabitans sp. LS3-19]MCP9766521.1 M56 family metallopeptidase [Lacihabitans sp. LS3-19]